MKNLLLPTLLLALTACDKAVFDDGARAEVRRHLKDPDSAVFEEAISYKNFTCIKYNAKNSFGGYAGASWTVLKQQGGSWSIVKSDESYCYETSLQTLAEPEKVAEKEQSDERVMAALRERQLVPPDATDMHAALGKPCYILGMDLIVAGHAVVDADDPATKARHQAKYDELMARVAKRQCET